MPLFCVGTGNAYSSKKAQFLLAAAQNQKMTPIQQDGKPGFPKYPISFPLFKVSAPQKFQMS